MTVAFTTRCGQNHCAVEYSVDLISAKDIAVTVQLQGKMEEDQVVTLLGSLPDSFSSLVTVLEAQADLTLDGVKQSLINEEQKRDGKLGMQGNTALSVRDERRCFKCKKVGHYKHECPQIRQERSETASAAVCSVCMMASDKNGPEEEEVAF